MQKKKRFEIYEALSNDDNQDIRNQVHKEASSKGAYYLKDTSGTNINVQVFDTAKINHP